MKLIKKIFSALTVVLIAENVMAQSTKKNVGSLPVKMEKLKLEKNGTKFSLSPIKLTTKKSLFITVLESLL